MSIQLTVMSLDFDSSAAPFTKTFDKEEITFGRLPGNDLVLERPEISGYHASLRVRHSDGKSTIFIKDLGSSNGTMVENSPLRPQSEVAVEPNQRIIIGNFLIKPALIEAGSRQSEILEQQSSGVASSEQSHEEEQVLELKKFSSSAVSTSEQEQEIEVHDVQAQEVRHQSNGGIVSTAPESTPSPELELVTKEPARKEFEIRVRVAEADVEELNFIAKRLLDLSGRISHKGNALAGVRVSDPELGECVSDADGVFSFSEIVEGSSYALQFEKEGFLFEDYSGELLSSEKPLSVAARKLRAIRGRVVHHGKPLAGVRVDGGDLLGSTRTDRDGYYSFEGVPEDAEYTLRLSLENYVLAPAK